MSYSKKALSNTRQDFIKGFAELIDVLIDASNNSNSGDEPYIDEDGNELRLSLDADENRGAVINLSIRQRNTNTTISVTGPIDEMSRILNANALSGHERRL